MTHQTESLKQSTVAASLTPAIRPSVSEVGFEFTHVLYNHGRTTGKPRERCPEFKVARNARASASILVCGGRSQ